MVATRTIEDYVNLERCIDALEDERIKLHHTITELLEILRQWEPDWSSGKDRRTIVLAMYQIGVLRDPTETVAAMKVGDDDTPMGRLFGCCADDADKTANAQVQAGEASPATTGSAQKGLRWEQ